MFIDFLRRNKQFLLLLVFLIPLIFIYLRDNYDWEGDTALLLFQANNIINGKPFYQSLYIYNPEFPILSPQYYPPMTSLFFAGIMNFFGDNIFVLMVFNSIVYFTIGILVYFLFIKFFNKNISLIISLLLMYNQFVIRIKQEIMSDTLFTLFTIVILLILIKPFDKIKNNSWIMAGLISGLAIETRSLGWTFPLTVVVVFFVTTMKYITKKENLGVLFKSVSFYFTGLFIVLFFFRLFFNSPSNGIAIYMHHFDEMSFNTIITNFALYIETVQDILISPLYGWGWIIFPVHLLILGVLTFGFFKSFRILNLYLLSFFLIYLFILIIYPYNRATLRFIFPIIPLIIIYFIIGFQSLIKYLPWKPIRISFVAILITGQLLIAVKGNYYGLKNMKDSDLVSASTLEAFSKIKEITNDTDIIQSSFPRIIAFYCDRKSYSSSNDADCKMYNEDIERFNASFLFYSRKYSSRSDWNYINEKKLVPIWQNEEYSLFQLERNQ